ncbi:MAG: hypothetical protein EBR34_08080 [Sphingomonadaceae bacterium]|nr:hypothetical protein [Sphingomonadaceae bacterium]
MSRDLLREALRPQAAPETRTLKVMRVTMMALAGFVCLGTGFIGFWVSLFGVGFSGLVGLALIALLVEGFCYFRRKNRADLAFAAGAGGEA